MATGSGADLLMFVAGEPESMPSIRRSGAGALPRWATLFTGTGLIFASKPKIGNGEPFNPDTYQQPPLSDVRPWHLPQQQMICLDLVLDVAEKQKKTVAVIDVDRPLDQKVAVDRWVHANDVLPLLVRSDGARLEGVENFEPAKVQRFIRGR